MVDPDIKAIRSALSLAERLTKQISDDIDAAALPRGLVLTRLIASLVDAAKAAGVPDKTIRKLIRASVKNANARGISNRDFDIESAKRDVAQLVREIFEEGEESIEPWHLTEIRWVVHDYVAKCSYKFAEPPLGWDEIREELHEHALYAAEYG